MTEQEKLAELEALEEKHHEIERKWKAGDYKRAWLGEGFIVEAYGAKFWIVRGDNNKAEIRPLI
ncbi:MAG: hypothetical protein LCI00_02185 [Chloroflexi bacterium]|nr:hypothetical protein [Chloroflexota bacterium]